MIDARFRVRVARWPEDIMALRSVREPVFVQEQKVPLDLEWDDDDPHCLHVLAEDIAGQPMGTGRLSPDGKIGRMAVLQPWRKRGVGAALLHALIEQARQRGMPECYLHAQVSALDFYLRHGFVAEGEEFDEAGIRHQAMRLRIEGAAHER
jgi:predicted GNAT family N-acyltransferase